MILYVVQQGNDGPVKIGIATDLKNRLAGLQTGNPVPLKVIKQFELDDSCAPIMEKELHHYFKHTRIAGEWFKLTPWMKRVIEGMFVDEEGILRNPDNSHCYAWRQIAEPFQSVRQVAARYRKEGDFHAVEYIMFEIDELKEDIKRGHS